jgi:hypothetical protein
VSNSKAVLALGHAGWPTLSASGAYQGPLPSTCGHRHNGSLVRKRGDSAFRSSGSSIYPELLDKELAHALHEDLLRSILLRSLPLVGSQESEPLEPQTRPIVTLRPRSTFTHTLGAPDDDKSGASPARHMAPITRESRQPSRASWGGHERSASKETRASLSTYFLSTFFPSSRPNESSQNYATSVRARGVDHSSAFVYHTSSVQTSSGPGERSLHRPHAESEQPLRRKQTGVHGAFEALSQKSPPVPWALKIHLDFDSGQ